MGRPKGSKNKKLYKKNELKQLKSCLHGLL